MCVDACSFWDTKTVKVLMILRLLMLTKRSCLANCRPLLRSEDVHILAIAKQTVRQQLGLLPVGGSHVIFAMSLLEGLTDPDSP